ncbi:MAG: hypothetical protein N2Z21_00380 [Candidatus Sumerlaeaceae bacterium]|nr:hypothetical protein [Candidatus Sumerlaeaceae bacterium]
MPIDKQTARRNLINLIQYQTARAEYGRLLLAVWYDIADESEDLYLFEVFENFVSTDGAAAATYRFPGMGYLWLPGLYHVTACSYHFFQTAASEGDEDVVKLRSQLADGKAEILFAIEDTDSMLKGDSQA